MILGPSSPAGHVVLVHGNQQRAEELAHLVRGAGHRVTVVLPTRRLAQEIVERAPDLLMGSLSLTDPPLGRVVRTVRQALADLPVLLVTAPGDPEQLVEADEILREPADPGELGLRVGALLRARFERRTLQRKVQDLLGLYKMSWAFSLAAGAQGLNASLSRQSAEMLKATKGLVMLFDAERRQMVAQVPGYGLSDDAIQRLRYSVDGEARSRWNFRRNGPLMSNKPQADSRLLPEVVSVADLHAVLMVPMVRPHTFYGLLMVADRASGEPFNDDDLNLLLAVASQATVAVENLALHDAIARKNVLLQEYDRVKSEFVAIVAHDFRKPLMAIRGFAELVMEDALPQEARQEFMRTVIQETDGLAALANDTLLMTRMETGKVEYRWEEVELGPFILDSVPLGLSDNSVLMDVPPDFPKIVTDPDRLRQLLNNLTTNAVKYSPGGGSILVRCRQRGADHVVIEVVDHGLGIPEDQIGRLFQKFVRVRTTEHMAVQGTGLGLYICRLIVEGMGGQIWVESELGRGSTFGFVLPLDGRAHSSDNATSSEPSSSAPARPEPPTV
jgi:signal transduction histidine kinase